MSQGQSRDEIGSHPLLQSGFQTPVQTPSRDASTPPVRHTTTTPTRLSTNQRSTPDSATPQRSLQLQEKAYEHDLHAHLHWTINPRNPKNWTIRKKRMHTLLFCAISWTIMLGASSLTLAHNVIMDEMRTSSIVSVLSTSLYLLGLVLGILGTPSADSMGRKSMYIISAPLYAIFILASGLTKSISGLAICRLLGGFVAASLLQLGYASILDIWPAEKRVVPIAAYTSTVLVGSTLGSVLSGAIVWRQHWRWTQFAILILSSLFYVPMFFTDETLKTMILRKSRKETSQLSLMRGFFNNESLRLRLILFSEPLALLCGVLNASHCGVLFAILTAFPDVLSKAHNFNSGAQGLVFLAMGIGALLALAMELCHQQWCYKPRAFSVNEKRKTWIPPSTLPPPEWRLWLALPASALNIASLFILGWTTHRHWMVTVIAMAIYAFGTSLTTVSTTLYVLECFDSPRNEAMWAGSSMLMFASGFAFSLFSIEELKLGPGLGMSVYAILSVLFGLIPAGLYIFGPALRKRRKSHDSK
ncbi:MFS transporter fsa7, partial [Pseudocercospora fuligena]